MKNNKGITLVSLMMYIIGMVAIAAIISVAVSFYNKNVLTMNDTSDVNMEFNKFDTKMVLETKTAGNKIESVTNNTIKFTSGNTYTFQDNKIYQNEIVVSDYVKEFIAKLETDGNKQMLRIYILFGKGQIEVVKNLSYVIENVATNEVTGSNTTVLQKELIPASDYGAYVTNYEVPAGGDPNVKWRIFYADESNVYLIASDYIHYDYAPTSANNTLYNNGNGYKLSFDNVYKDYTGSADITDPRITKWISYVSENPSSINTNIKAVAFMLDEARWSAKYAKPEYAEYAIGGPTLELWCASYKATHDRYIECTYNSTGYQVKWSDSAGSPSNSVSGAEDDNDLYYIKSITSKCSYMWLASPSASLSNYLMNVSYLGNVLTSYYLNRSAGFRPLVCLQSGIPLEKQTDGTYLIK